MKITSSHQAGGHPWDACAQPIGHESRRAMKTTSGIKAGFNPWIG